MRLVLVLALVLPAACGGDDSGGGAAPATTAGPTGSDSAATEDDVTAPASDGIVDGTLGSDTVADTDEPSPATLCWQVEELGALSADIDGTRVYDSDGDGAQELWGWKASVDLATTELHRLSVGDQGSQTLDGVFVALTDVDGDGNLDALMRDSQGLFQIHFGDGVSFGAAGSAVTAPVGDVVGAFDLDGDGDGDLLIRSSDVALLAAVGAGDGSYETAATLGVPAQAAMDAHPMADQPGWFALRSRPSPEDGACNVNRIDTIRYSEGRLQSSATGPMSEWDVPLAVVDVGGEGNPDVFVVACDTIPSITDLRLLIDDGSGGISDMLMASDVQWAVPADVNGDGSVDLVWGDEVEGAMLVRLDAAGGGDGAQATGVGAATVEHNAVHAGELDAQPGQEVLLGVVDGAQTRYDRIFVVDCP